jgi:hypothetical protein
MPPRVFLALLLALGGAIMAGAQQPSAEEQPDNQPTEQKVITDPAEYEAYIAAINTVDLADRKAALDAFLERFPNSVMREHVGDLYLDIIVQVDNQRTAPLRQRLRSAKIESVSAARLPQVPDNLAFYTQCVLDPYKADQYAEHNYPTLRWVATARGEFSFEVVRGLSHRISLVQTPFLKFQVEKLKNYANAKKLLVESLEFMRTKPGMSWNGQLPLSMNGFEVYRVNHRYFGDGISSISVLFRNVDQTVVTFYQINAPLDSPAERMSQQQFPGWHLRFLETYAACTDTILKATR